MYYSLLMKSLNSSNGFTGLIALVACVFCSRMENTVQFEFGRTYNGWVQTFQWLIRLLAQSKIKAWKIPSLKLHLVGLGHPVPTIWWWWTFFSYDFSDCLTCLFFEWLILPNFVTRWNGNGDGTIYFMYITVCWQFLNFKLMALICIWY